MRQQADGGADDELRLPADGRYYRRAAAFERDVRDVDAGHLLEQFHRHVRAGGNPAGAVIQFARLRLRVREQVLHRFHWQRGVHHQNIRQRRQQRDRREIVHRIKR